MSSKPPFHARREFKNTIVMTSILGVLGILDCSVFGHSVTGVAAGRSKQ
jgi:hypothetical protein